MKTEHINITIPADLRQEVDRAAKQKRTKRSTLIQRAVRVYLGLSRQRALRALLEEGYAELSDEAKRLEREFEALDRDSLRHVD